MGVPMGLCSFYDYFDPEVETSGKLIGRPNGTRKKVGQKNFLWPIHF